MRLASEGNMPPCRSPIYPTYRPETETLTEHWGSDLVNLMERMWHHDPNERPLMSDVVDDLTAIMEARRRA